MDFEIVGEITVVETIAAGKGIRDLRRLRRSHGKGQWRKMKGIARIRLMTGAYGSRSFIGTRRTGSGKKKSSGNATWMMTMKRPKTARHFAVCINNRGYPASLELHKIYRVLPDEGAAEDGDIRVIDESGEDYLYAADRFVEVELPQTVRRSLLHAA